MHDTPVAGDAIPPGSAVIEVRVAELRQLFNAIDPSPFRERDLDPSAEAFIVDWSREAPADAVHQFFAERREASRRRLHQLFRTGRTYLIIGLAVLGVCITLSHVLLRGTGEHGVGALMRESLLIGGWVAMWRPLEVFLYDWWPIRADMRLFGRLAAMPVSIRSHRGPSRGRYGSLAAGLAGRAPDRGTMTAPGNIRGAFVVG